MWWRTARSSFLEQRHHWELFSHASRHAFHCIPKNISLVSPPVDHSLISDIAVCIIAAWVLAVGAHLLKQPVILAYLVAGFVVGPIGLGWVKEAQSIELISEIGLSLLLFMIGLEIDLKKMMSAGRVITLTAVTQIVGGCALGLVFFWAMGFGLGDGKLDALYLAVAAAMSSTVIIVKILYDKRELDTLAGRLTLGVLVVQDLVAILFLALQPNLQDPSALLLLLSLAKVVSLVAVAFTASRFILPPIFRAVARMPELVLVGALAWCFMLAGMASALGLSREMGALVAGVALSTSPYTLDVTAKVTSLRDFFITLFFVALGMKIPAPSGMMLAWALVLVVFVVVSRFATVFPLLHWLRQGHRVSLLPAINLSQVSEFSLVILILGVKAKHIDSHTLDVCAYAFVILAVASTYLVTRSDALVRYLSPRLARMGVLDLDKHNDSGDADGHRSAVVMLGFFRTESSLLEELTRAEPALLNELTVIDFNPEVNQQLRKRNVRVIYGDISQRDTLLHAGVGHAEILVCALPNALLKGTTKRRLVRQLRDLNATAKIIVTTDLFADVEELYAVGANFVCLPRLAEADELCAALLAARRNSLDTKRAAFDAQLAGRQEVVP